MAAWIKMPLGTHHCIRCGPTYPQKKGTPTHSVLSDKILSSPLNTISDDSQSFSQRLFNKNIVLVIPKQELFFI